MAEVRADNLLANDWGGGTHPYRVSHRKLGMWLFIMSDSLTFCALLIAYSYARFSSQDWPTPFPFSPSIIFSTGMTLVLLSSSLTMVFAVSAAKRRAWQSRGSTPMPAKKAQWAAKSATS